MHSDGILRLVAVPLLVAAILGAWAYSATRASKADVLEIDEKITAVDRKGEIREEKINKSLDLIEDSVHVIEVEQAAFRAQVREALRIPRPD